MYNRKLLVQRDYACVISTSNVLETIMTDKAIFQEINRYLPETAVILSWIFLRQVRRVFSVPRTDFGINFKSLVYIQNNHSSSVKIEPGNACWRTVKTHATGIGEKI